MIDNSNFSGQLKEIRKTSLAKLICDCSDGIDHIQPEVMRSVGPDNPMTSCEDIAGPDFAAWKDPSSPPILKAVPTADQPETWLNFKTTINNTVQEIVGFFSKTLPAPGSPDWTTFKDWVNKSFADIRSEVSSLRPKPLQSIASLSPTQSAKNEANSQPLKAKTSVSKAAKFDYMKFAMNRSLTDIDKYTKTATTQPTTYEDWMSFKTDIKKYLNDALVNATGTPTAEQRKELKKQIESEIDDIKSRIASLATTRLYLANEATTEDPAATADWLKFKMDVVKAITDAVDRIKAKAPPPGDPSWATFGLEIKNQFSSVKDHIPVLPTVKLAANDPSAAAYWDGFRDSLNRSISSAVAEIGDGMPPPGDPAWAAFSAKIMKDFAQFRDKFEAKPKLKASATGNVGTFDWIKFKSDIIKSVADTVNEIKKNMPPPGSPSWTAFRGQIMNGFAKIPSEVPALKLNVGGTAAKLPETEAFDWMTLKKDITKSVSDIIDGDSTSTDLPAGDPRWAAFGAKFAKFNRSFEVIKSEIDDLRPKPEVAQVQLLTTDWTEFKEKINESLKNSMDSMQSKPPMTADPGWVSFRDSIKDEFDALKKEIATAKSDGPLMAARVPPEFGYSTSSGVKETFYFPELPVELLSLQTKANKTLLQLKESIVNMKLGATAPVISAADWITFKQEIKDAVANFVSARNASETVEWTKMRDSVQKSFADLRDQIAAVRNSTGILQKISQVQNGKAIEALKEKKAKDSTKGGKFNPAKSETIFDWEKLKTDINATIDSLMGDLGKIVPGKTPSKTLEESLVRAQVRFANLQLSPSPIAQMALPDDWAVFVNGVNKTLNSVMKKIGALKPVDETDSAALESYEKEVDDFFDEIKDVVDKKKSEFAAATSTASQISGSKASLKFLITTTMIMSVWIIAAF